MTELEQKIKESVDAIGGRIYGIRVGLMTGFPRYMIILPGGHVGFVEVGRPEKTKLRALTEWVKDLRALGCAAAMVDDESRINRMIMYILSDAGKDPAWNAYQDYRRVVKGYEESKGCDAP